jgi:hypothetical protein
VPNILAVVCPVALALTALVVGAVVSGAAWVVMSEQVTEDLLLEASLAIRQMV